MVKNKSTDEIKELVSGLLKGLSVKRYIDDKPTAATDTEYIVINALPIDANPMQICVVNVNYHVRDIAEGVKDQAKLIAGYKAVLNILEKCSTTAYMIDFETQETFRDTVYTNEHFSNIRFIFKQINY